jgi:demethoxyubiquinone hydroxylase (CLK1/Coq7/Cat5 family)
MESSNRTLDALNALLRGELSAVAIYRYTYERVTHPRFRACLDDCMQSHARRIQLLHRRIHALGGIPTRSAGAWGVLVGASGLLADLFGATGALTLLELGESHGRAAYQRKLAKLDPQSRRFVEAQLMPAQALTHEWISELKRGARVMLASIDSFDR